MTIGQSFAAGANAQILKQDRLLKEQQFKDAETQKRLQNAKQSLSDIIKTIVQARQQGATPDQLAGLANIPIKTQQSLILTGDVSPGSIELVKQILQNALNTTTDTETAKREAEQKGAIKKAETLAKLSGERLTRVISGDDPINKRLGLGIPKGKSATVDFFKDAEGNIQADVKASFGSGQNINIDARTTGVDKFLEESGKLDAQRLNKMIDDGNAAVDTGQELLQMATLLKAGVQTGNLQPAITSLQGIAADLGIDLAKTAESLGIDIGKLADKEQFNRLSRRIIIDGFEKFKGNLNKKEVEIAMDAFANLGTSENANISAIAAAMAASKIARDRGIDATNITSQAELRALVREQLSNDTDRFEVLKQEFEKEIRDQLNPTAEELPEGVPEGSVKKVKNGKTFFITPDEQILVVE